VISQHDREVLRDAWAGHCDALRQVSDEVINGELGDPRDGDELAELLRSVGRFAALSLQHRLDFNDPDFPLFFRQMDDRFRYGGPDTNIAYFMAAVRGDAEYRVRGNNAGRSLNIGRLWHDNIETDADGNFELYLSAQERGVNWTPLDPATRGDTHIPEQYPIAGGAFGIRRYDWDWDKDLAPGWLTIERVDAGAPAYPPPLSAAQLAAQIENATRFFLAASRWWNRRATAIRRDTPVNTITPPSTSPPGVKDFKVPSTGGKAWLYYGVICFDLAEDEAIFIETELPDGPYWSFTLYNMWWESPDIMNRQTALNANQSHVDTDGKARFVISSRDPGIGNWLDTGGGRRGFLHYRWFRPNEAIPTPTARVIKAAHAAELFPSDHPRLDAAQRKAAISVRREQLAKRFQR
jgi:hypothetical protein